MRAHPISSRSARRTYGFSLVELLIGMSIFAALLLALQTVFQSSDQLSRSTAARARLLGDGSDALRRVAAELAPAGLGTLSAAASSATGADSVDFLRVIGSNGTTLTWSSITRIESQLAADELDNGLDDDSDGLIDEHRLVVIRDLGGANQKQTVLSSNLLETFPEEAINNADDNGNGVIDERGFNAFVSGDSIVLRLALQIPDGGGGRLVETFETRVHPRN